MKTPADHDETFCHGPPRRRFQDRYWRHRENRHQQPMVKRIVLLTLGVVLLVLGVLMLVLPGPGIVCLALAGGLFAAESLRIARGLDWIEARLRSAGRRMRERVRPRGSLKPR